MGLPLVPKGGALHHYIVPVDIAFFQPESLDKRRHGFLDSLTPEVA